MIGTSLCQDGGKEEAYDMSSKIKEVRSPFSPWEESSSRDQRETWVLLSLQLQVSSSSSTRSRSRSRQCSFWSSPSPFRFFSLPSITLLHPQTDTGSMPPAKLMVKTAFYLWCYLKMQLFFNCTKMQLFHMDFDLDLVQFSSKFQNFTRFPITSNFSTHA